MTDTLAHLESLARAATPGPWGRWNRDATRVRRYFGTSGYDDICQASTGENAAYIAALSPESVLALLAVIEAAKAMRDAGVSIGQRVVLPDAEPDSMADDTALGEFIGIFDGPLQRDFDAAIDAAKEKP